MARLAVLITVFCSLLSHVYCLGSTDTITSGGDNTRSGYMDNHNMDPAVVGSSAFDQLWTTQLKGNYMGFTEQTYAQPLVYTPPGQRQFVFVATMMNYVYRIDAITGAILQYKQLCIPFLVSDLDGCNDISNLVGSTSTGVIDPTTNTWYLTTKTYIDQTGATTGKPNGRYLVHALDVMTLQERPGFPVDLEGMTGDNAPWRVFQGGIHHQRPALTQIQDKIYFGFASHCVQYNFTGWLMGMSTNGTMVAKWAMEGGNEVGSKGGGVWMSGGGPSSDNSGRIFVATGNGYASELSNTPVPGHSPPLALEEAVVNFAINDDGSLQPTDFFMPWEKPALDGADKDLGTSGIILLNPRTFSTSKVARMGCITGKTGKLYFLDLSNLGGYQMGPNRLDAAVQVTQLKNAVFASAGSYPLEGGFIYINVVGNPSVVFSMSQDSNGYPVFTQVAQTNQSSAGRQGVGHGTVTGTGKPGGGIFWVTDVEGVTLRAYSAVPVNGILPTLKLLNANGQSKFSRPVFGDGKVYVSTNTGQVICFGSPVNLPLNCSSPDFGNVNIGSSASAVVSCTANVNTVLTSANVTTTTSFGVSGLTLPLTLSAGQSISFNASFAPASTGPLSTNLNLGTTNGVNGYSSNTAVVVKGIGISAKPVLAVSPPTVSFGGIVLGTNGGSNLTFVTSNTGIGTMTITGYMYSNVSTTGPYLSGNGNVVGAFTFYNLPAVGQTIAGGSSLAATINFNPGASSNYQAYLTIITNGGNQTLVISGQSGGAPIAGLEFSNGDGTFQYYNTASPSNLTFGTVVQGTSAYRTFYLNNTGGETLMVSVSKAPSVGKIAAVNPQGDISEGSQVAPGSNETAAMYCAAPPSQVNVDPYTVYAQWTMNNNDPTFTKQFVQFACNIVSQQVGPLQSNGQARYRYVGCFKDNDPGRMLPNQVYSGVNNTNDQCTTQCATAGYTFAASEYQQECWCGNTLPKTRVAEGMCGYQCTGDNNETCGGFGGYMSLFADVTTFNMSSVPAIGSAATATTSTTATSTAAATATASSASNANSTWASAGCVSEGSSSRALTGISTDQPGMTPQICQSFCAGYAFAGVEYSTQCFCGNLLSNGASNSTQCTMVCGGDSTQTCGGPNALTLFSNTAYNGPVVVPSVGNYQSIGCYTEGNGGRLLSSSATSGSSMSVEQCVSFCSGYQYAGVEYGQECYCGNTFSNNGTVAVASDCSMSCAGNGQEFCGAGNRLNVYSYTNSTTVSSSTVVLSSSISSTSSVSTSTANAQMPITTGGSISSSSIPVTSITSSKPTTSIVSTSSVASSTSSSKSSISASTSTSIISTISSTVSVSSTASSSSSVAASSTSSVLSSSSASALPSTLSTVSSSTSKSATQSSTFVSPSSATTSSIVSKTAISSSTVLSSSSSVVSNTTSTGLKATSTSSSIVSSATSTSVSSTSTSSVPKTSTTIFSSSASTSSVISTKSSSSIASFTTAPSSSKASSSFTTSSTSTSLTTMITMTTSKASTTSSTSTSTKISSSTSTSPTVFPTSSSGWQYLGCSNDSDYRVLSQGSYTSTTSMTNERCQAYCLSLGLPLSGTEFSRQCFCGSAIQNYGSLSFGSECSSACSGDSTQKCGGYDRISIYNYTLPITPVTVSSVSTPNSGFTSQGCFTEGWLSKALTGYSSTSNTMTPESCVTLCDSKGFQYAGVENGNTCTCGNSMAWGSYRTIETRCSTQCVGNNRELCGGSSVLELYSQTS